MVPARRGQGGRRRLRRGRMARWARCAPSPARPLAWAHGRGTCVVAGASPRPRSTFGMPPRVAMSAIGRTRSLATATAVASAAPRPQARARRTPVRASASNGGEEQRRGARFSVRSEKAAGAWWTSLRDDAAQKGGAALASLALALAAGTTVPPPALAELNVYEAARGGEFGFGSAQQLGGIDIRGSVRPQHLRWQSVLTSVLTSPAVILSPDSDACRVGRAPGAIPLQDHHNEDLRRSNLTSTDLRDADFSYTLLNGAYLEKAVMYRTDFTGELTRQRPSSHLQPLSRAARLRLTATAARRRGPQRHAHGPRGDEGGQPDGRPAAARGAHGLRPRRRRRHGRGLLRRAH
eukprot:scaffold2010_cov301-Prasinococcus_capsulatus_cf.AAC.10